MVWPLWKTCLQFLIKLKLKLPYDPAILFLRIYPREMKTSVYTKNCTWLFITTLLVIAPNWKQTKCPTIGEWLNKHPYHGYYSAIKWNKLLIHKTAWMDLKGIMLSEKNPVSKGHILYGFIYIAF